LVMLAIGRSVFRPRLHSSRPVAATSIAAAFARTPLGPAAEGRAPAELAAGRTTLATDAGAATVSAMDAARTEPARSPVTRAVR